MTISYVTPALLQGRLYRKRKNYHGLCTFRSDGARWLCCQEENAPPKNKFARFVQRAKESIAFLKTSSLDEKEGVLVEKIEVDAADLQGEVSPDILKELIGDNMMQTIYNSIVCEVVEILERAKKILNKGGDCRQETYALLQLLEMAKYQALSTEEAERGEALEGCADQLPVFISETGFDDTFLVDAISSDRILGVPKEGIAFFPNILIAWKGIGIQKIDGVQLKAKLRGFEAKYLGWIEEPFDWVITKLARVRGQEPQKNSGSGRPAQQKSKNHTIERISPSRKLELGVDSLFKLFKPIRTAEPVYSSLCIIYRGLSERSLRQRLNVVKEFKKQIGKHKEGEENVKQSNGRPVEDEQHNYKVDVDVLSDVPWAALNNYLPGRYLSFATKDILRLDAFTLAGIVAAVTTYIQDFGTFYIGFTISASLIYYGSRVFFSIQSAWNSYHRKITSDILKAVVGRGRGGMLAIADEAVQCRFTEACLLAYEIEKSDSLHEATESATRLLKSKYDVDFTFIDGGVGALESLQKLGLVESRRGFLVSGEKDPNKISKQ